MKLDPNTGDGNITTQTYKSYQSVYIRNNGFYKNGYILIGWATTANGSPVYRTGEKVTAENNTLYAAWEEALKATPVKPNVFIENKTIQNKKVVEVNKTNVTETSKSIYGLSINNNGIISGTPSGIVWRGNNDEERSITIVVKVEYNVNRAVGNSTKK